MDKNTFRFFPWKVTWKRTLIESGIFLSAYFIWLIFRSPDSPSRALIGSLAVLTPLATAVLYIVWAQPLLEKSIKRSWNFLGIALACWLVGGLIRTYHLAFRFEHMPIVSIADAVNFLGYPFVLFAIIFYPSQARYLPSRFRFLLDATISSIVILALGWLVIARPAAQSSGGSVLQLLPLAYPVADMVLLMILINTLLANPVARRNTLLWSLGLLAFFVSDYIYSYQAIIQDYQAGGVESLGWVIGGLLFGVSIILESTTTREESKIETVPDAGVRLQNILPIVLVLVLIWFVLADWRLRGEPSVFGLWVAIVMGVSVIVRLGVRAGEVELHRYWQLFRGLQEPTFICNLDGKLLVANPALIKTLGLESESQVVKKDFPSILKGYKRPLKLLERAEYAATSAEVNLEGSKFPYLLSLNPIFTENKEVLIAGIAYNLNDQKQQKDALQKANDELRALSQRLETLNAQLEQRVTERTQTLSQAYRKLEEQNKILQTFDKLKSDFVSMVSHELRTPLTSLSGGLELLMARPGRQVENKETLSLLKNEVHRLAHFVENVLSLSVIEAGRLEPHIEPLDLNLIVQDVLRSMSNIPVAKRISVKIPNNLPQVRADEGFIHSVMTQLLDNALKYAEPSLVIIDVRKINNKLRVRVTDRGPGIPAGQRKLLFRRFQRLDATDSQSIYGYGLGLYLSKQLLRSIKSDLHYEAPSQGGARFFFDLEVIE